MIIKFRFLLYFLLLLTSPLLYAGSPRIEFEEIQFDFGDLIQGETVQHSFSFRNAGDAVLEIFDVRTSCGCTAALISDSLIPPGGKGQIEVSYDSKGKIGEVTKYVRVDNNDPKKPTVNLVMKGMVIASLHSEITGSQNLFQGSCGQCHMEKGVGKVGQALYEADCAICHENHKKGGKFIALAVEDMARLSSWQLDKAITKGQEGTSMPAFYGKRKGPLSREQIKSLVDYILTFRK